MECAQAFEILIIYKLFQITEWLKLEATSGDYLVQPPCSSRATYSQLPRTMSRQLLNISKDRDTSEVNITF